MDPLEVGAVQQAMPQGIIELGAQTSEEVQMAIDRARRTTDARHTCDCERWFHEQESSKPRDESCEPTKKQSK